MNDDWRGWAWFVGFILAFLVLMIGALSHGKKQELRHKLMETKYENFVSEHALARVNCSSQWNGWICFAYQGRSLVEFRCDKDTGCLFTPDGGWQ